MELYNENENNLLGFIYLINKKNDCPYIIIAKY